MKTEIQIQSKRARGFAYKLRRRLKVAPLLGWKKRKRQSPPPPIEAPRRGRSREDQITIEVLRYRVDHPGAMRRTNGEAVFDEAFKEFILHRCESGAKNFNHRKFARAAGIPAATLRLWLLEQRTSLFEAQQAELATPERTGIAVARPQPITKKKRSWGEIVRAIKIWIVEGLRPEPILPIGFHPYGGIELKRKRQRFTIIGFVCATVLHFAGVGMYWMTLEKGETPKTVTLLKYVELRSVEIEEPKKEQRRVSEGGGGGEGGGAQAAASNLAVVPDSYVPMADIAVIQDEIAQIVKSGMPALPGSSNGMALGNIVGSSNPLALSDLKFGANGYSSNNSSDPSGLGLPQGIPGGQGQGYVPGLGTAKVGYGGGGTGSGAGNYGSGSRAGGSGVNRGGSGPGTGGVTVTKVTAEDIKKTRTSIDFNKLFGELTDWMSNNEVELPLVVKQYMRCNTGDITSKVTIEASPISYDLFLLANKQSQDIGLLLVSRDEASNAILLRDTGFRKKSFTLHEGVAGRDEGTNNLLSLSMSEEDPTHEETERFYNIILAWWENRVKGAQNP